MPTPSPSFLLLLGPFLKISLQNPSYRAKIFFVLRPNREAYCQRDSDRLYVFINLTFLFFSLISFSFSLGLTFII